METFLKQGNNLQDPLVGVIIPFYDVEAYFHKCLDSIVNQTYKNLKIVLINDGSNDKSFKIAKSFQEKDARITIINSPNRGTSVARNLGLKFMANLPLPKELASNLPKLMSPPDPKIQRLNHDLILKNTRFQNDKLEIIRSNSNLEDQIPDFIHFCDSDDWLAIDCIEKCVNELKDFPNAEIIWHGGIDCDDIKNTVQKSYVLDKLGLDFHVNYSGSDIYKAIKRPHFTWVCNGMVKFDVILKNDLFFKENIVLEDELFARKLFALVKNVVLIPENSYFYRIRKNSNCQYYFSKEDEKLFAIPEYKLPLLRYFDLRDTNMYFTCYSFLEIVKELVKMHSQTSNLDIKKGLEEVISYRLYIVYSGLVLKRSDPYLLRSDLLGLLHLCKHANYIKFHNFLCQIGIVRFKRSFMSIFFKCLGKIKRIFAAYFEA